MTRLLLVRHGQSVWNASGRWQGQADPPLSSLGHEQARAAASGLEAVGDMVAVASSDLVRAQQTAVALQRAAEIDQLAVDPRLRERHAGEWQGLTRPEIDDRYPGYLDDGRRPPGWESAEDLFARAMAALEELAATHEGAVCVVVTHAGVIYAVEAAHGRPHERIANLSGRWVEFGNPGPVLGDRLDLLGGRAEATIPDQI